LISRQKLLVLKVISLKIGVVSVQGAISEHVDALNRATAEMDIENVQVLQVRKDKDVDTVDGLIIPGGESTTISKLLVQFGLFKKIIKRVKEEELPILGTCAGCIVLASEGDIEVDKTQTELLKLMNMRVIRNAYGSQRESFESDITINAEGFSEPYHAVFIRAPVIGRIWGECRSLATLEGRIILARQGNLIAAAFHPELTDDMRIHKYFLELV
jgi:5'-phosphate synthase pdxT subunit